MRASSVALDYYHTVTPMPPDESPPPIGSPLQRYIVSRQGDAHESTASKFGMIFIPGHTAFIGKVAESLNPDSIQNALKYGPTPICLARTAFDGGAPGGHHLLALACSGTSELTIDVYDPNFPDQTVQITGSDSSGFTNQESKSTWSHVFVDYGWRKQKPPLFAGR